MQSFKCKGIKWLTATLRVIYQLKQSNYFVRIVK